MLKLPQHPSRLLPFHAQTLFVDSLASQQENLILLFVPGMNLQIRERLQAVFDLFLAHVQILSFKHLAHFLPAGNRFHFHFQDRVNIIGISHIHSLLSGFPGGDLDEQFSQRQVIDCETALAL